MTGVDWTAKRTPAELVPEPWLSPHAAAFFFGLLRSDMRVVEFGSGCSTLWLAQRVGELWSYETDPDWYVVVRERTGSWKHVRVELWDGTQHVDVPEHDLLYSDGPYALREAFTAMAWPRLVPGGWMVFDNSNKHSLVGLRARYMTLSQEFLGIEHQPRPHEYVYGATETGFFRKMEDR